MDIETFIKDNIHVPYAISWHDGVNSFSYYLTDFKNSDSMITLAIKDLMIKKYDNYKVYIHNLARFDGIFLLRILANLGECNPIIHNDKIISIGFRYKDYDVSFRDSLQLLISPLRNLAKSFGVDTQKSIFPYTFVNENNLNYIGDVPELKYFDISETEYLNYSNEFEGTSWNLKDETIKYCEIDCISLHQIVSKFNELIFERFKINIFKYPTLSSLAFAIFRTKFLLADTISQLSGQTANEIREGYTLNKIIEKWEELENVNEDIQTIIGEEVFERMDLKFKNLENDLEDRFEELEEELLDTFRYPMEDLINSPFEELNSWDFTHWLIFLLIIGFIFFKYSKTNSLYTMSISIPFSLFEIDFRDSFEWKFNSYRVKPVISYFKIQTLAKDIIELLNSLKDDENYSMSLSFISSYNEWQENKVKIDPLFIDDAIIINKESDPILITQFIMKRLDDKGLFITDWLLKDSSINSMDPVILTVIVAIKVKI
jgi:DNA polymerase type B, organellar and viral